MKRLLVLGAGTAGTMVVNKLHRRLPKGDWSITVVDRDDQHVYQPGLLLLPFGAYIPEDLVKPRDRFLPDGVELFISEIDSVDADRAQVILSGGRTLDYDYLVIATGTSPQPEQTAGMVGPEWRTSVFDFYTLDGATALRDKLAGWNGGRLVVHVTEMPIKCPVAPLEFAFLADAFFEQRRMRNSVDMTYVTPLDGAFTRPTASRRLSGLLADRHISVETDFVIDRIDPERKALVSVDDREVAFDLLVTVPLNMGAEFVARSGLGDELNYVPVDKQTLQSTAHPNIFALGDACDIPTSKAGSTAHFAVEVFTGNFLQLISGHPMTHRFDGHANCFIESGHGKALLIDFDYDTEPLPGRYPLSAVGPFTLLGESRANHMGKLGMRHAYWHLLLRGRRLPLPARKSTPHFAAARHT